MNTKWTLISAWQSFYIFLTPLFSHSLRRLFYTYSSLLKFPIHLLCYSLSTQELLSILPTILKKSEKECYTYHLPVCLMRSLAFIFWQYDHLCIPLLSMISALSYVFYPIFSHLLSDQTLLTLLSSELSNFSSLLCHSHQKITLFLSSSSNPCWPHFSHLINL